MGLELYILFLCLLLSYIMYLYKKIHYRFESAGVKYLPGVPIFGNVWKSTFLRRHYIYDLDEVYTAFPDEKYVGFADGMVPVILVRDPELMKTITIKDFDHFQNRKEFFPVHLDPLLGRNLLQLKDEEWKTFRSELSPAFTAARLRYMLPAMILVSKNVVNTLRSKYRSMKNGQYVIRFVKFVENAVEKEDSSKEVDLAESMYRYAGDSLTSAGFGVDQANAGQEDSVFFKFAATIYLNTWRRVLIFIFLQFPNLGRGINYITGLQIFSKETHNFITNVVSEELEYRNNKNISVPDYMDILKKICHGKSINDLAGQFFFSYVASLESGSGALKLCLHELALNPLIQERLYQEIRAHEESKDMTLKSIAELEYLDCVLKETTRRWSAAVVMDRKCTKRYVLPPSREGGKPYTVQRGETIFNVVNSVHMDPKYYPRPDVFDPERFSAENKNMIRPFTFMPFGMGPRGCLGARFAILQLKVMVYQMVLNFKLVKCEKTCDPIQLEPDELNMRVRGGTWVRLELRG